MLGYAYLTVGFSFSGQKLIDYVQWSLCYEQIFLPSELRQAGPRLSFFCTKFCPLCKQVNKQVIAMCPYVIKD